MFKLTPDQQDVINNGAILFRALSQNRSDVEFKKIVIAFQKKDGDVNALSQTGNTILDVALSLPLYSSKVQFLKSRGAKTSREIGHIPNNISDRIIEAYDPNVSMFMPTAVSSKPLGGDLYNVNFYIESQLKFDEHDQVIHQLKKSKSCVGLVTASGMGVGTCFLIGKNMIITSRHVLNGIKLNELKIVFPSSIIQENIPPASSSNINTERSGAGIAYLQALQEWTRWLLTFSPPMINTFFNFLNHSFTVISGEVFSYLLSHSTGLRTIAVMFNADLGVEVSGLIEDGSHMQLDYAVLRLKTSVNNEFIPKLSSNRQPTFFTFIGYDSDEEMYFTNHIPQGTSLTLIGAHQETFQQTGFSFSGSPYFNESDDVYALHQNAGHNKKQSLYITEICEQHDNSSANVLITQWQESELLEVAGGVFDFVSLSDISQYDEGEARGYTLGKNPSVSKDELGGKNNLVCQEVLYRWALRGKARYIGNKVNRHGWIQDWENWEVSIRKNDTSDREWVSLNEKRPNGKPAIQMGHKLSAVSYWVYGYNHIENTILKNDFAEYKKSKGDQKWNQKKAKYDTRYALFATAGFKQVESDNAVVNRKFMYMAQNYRFEWAELNEQHGKSESKVLTYSSIFSLQPQPTQDELKKYRALRKDKETSPIIQAALLTRRSKLTTDIVVNHQNFVKK